MHDVSGAPRTVRKPGPPLWLALILLVLGVIVALPPGVVIVVRAVRTFTSPAFTTPGAVQRHLGSGTWFVYEQTGTTSRFGLPSTHDSGPELDPTQVTVTDASGATLAVSPVSVNETITESHRIYTAEVQFRVQTAGDYNIRITTPAAGQVLITRSLGDTIRGLAPFALVGSVGGLLVLVGVVLLGVGAFRRSRVRPAGVWSGPASPPAGWYPDPGAPGRHRWWDGARWTQHQG